MKDIKLAGMLTLLLITLTIPIVVATSTKIQSTNSLGNPRSKIAVSDDVYVTGSDFPSNAEITIHVMDPKLEVDVASSTVTTDDEGSIPVTLLWSGPLHVVTFGETTIYRARDYEYEIWADLNQNGQRDDGDVSCTFTVDYPESNPRKPGPPAFHVPELGTVLLMMAMFGAFAIAYLARKRV